jgi:hypothetical protein
VAGGMTGFGGGGVTTVGCAITVGGGVTVGTTVGTEGATGGSTLAASVRVVGMTFACTTGNSFFGGGLGHSMTGA